MPGRTLFYLLWRGTPSGEIRKNNAAFALWDDPQFASARASFLDSVVNDSANQKSKTALSREEFEQYVTLLDNPFLIGNLRRPEARPAQKSSADQVAAPPAWNGTFFIYDRTGKEELLSKAVVRMRSTEKDIPKLTELTVAGIPALKVERKSGVTYWAEFGKYAVSANEMTVFEEVLNVVNGKSAGTALGQSDGIPGSQASAQWRNIGIFSGRPFRRANGTGYFECGYRAGEASAHGSEAGGASLRCGARFVGRCQNANDGGDPGRYRSWWNL